MCIRDRGTISETIKKSASDTMCRLYLPVYGDSGFRHCEWICCIVAEILDEECVNFVSPSRNSDGLLAIIATLDIVEIEAGKRTIFVPESE